MVIALARKGKGKGVKKMSFDEIAQKAGMTRRTIHRFANRISWNGVAIESIQNLCDACSVDLISQWGTLDYLNKTRHTSRPFAHLSRKYFNKVCRLGGEWNQRVIKPSDDSTQ
tara:strand:+ start:376 stop:714 length:339 start_codon:yes stop_codon:yes gene_type:complete